ncbi:hypothetical protein OOK41_01255 [Micromonospora sp. NBC_01655]|uniref:hypothetical protein n=1 Tax=Micromonospora sp. NBC_01655 TaxID=2975983 RepID=UPI002250EE30|nr:hypothetical protein [Micromonospora sp. NBC_01655]MCX4468951.1 hypothetical protein [Micromonospora sp. NBC_01655]
MSGVVDLVEQSTEPVARARAERIRAGIHSYLETLAEIALAWERRDWAALGYESWAGYVDGEFGAERLRLPVEHRQRAVVELQLAGMSQRAIGAALAVDAATVNRDLRAAGVADATPRKVRGTDGKAYAATRPAPAPAAAVVGPAPGDQVWMATARQGITGHAPRSKTSTRCNRSTRTGLTTTAGLASEAYAATWCAQCWPRTAVEGAGPAPSTDGADVDTEAVRPGTPVVPDVDSAAPAPALPSSSGGAGVTPDPDPLAGVGEQYETDPRRRIAAVAEVAPEFVRPAPAPAPALAAGCTAEQPPVDGPARLTVQQISRLRAAVAYVLHAGTRTVPRQYAHPFTSSAPVLSQPGRTVELADVQWWPDGEVHVRFLAGGGRYCVTSTEFYAAGIDQALDVLCALGLLPAHLSTLYAAGVRAGIRAGDAIDGRAAP